MLFDVVPHSPSNDTLYYENIVLPPGTLLCNSLPLHRLSLQHNHPQTHGVDGSESERGGGGGGDENVFDEKEGNGDLDHSSE